MINNERISENLRNVKGVPEPKGSKGSRDLGNTNNQVPKEKKLKDGKSRLSAAKNWCFTLCNYTEEHLAQLDQYFSGEVEFCKYLYGKETAPTTGTPHLQGFIIYGQKQRPFEHKELKGMGIHWEKMKGTVYQNILYCCKQRNITTNITDEDNYRE